MLNLLQPTHLSAYLTVTPQQRGNAVLYHTAQPPHHDDQENMGARVQAVSFTKHDHILFRVTSIRSTISTRARQVQYFICNHCAKPHLRWPQPTPSNHKPAYLSSRHLTCSAVSPS